mmetsp:Transcript_10802/g.28714  ORF Transcript_10802/g.28714 Transcript_10802/m.28714 type:complete len:278 (-) Transcript_10802:560-1393(-)
MTAAMPAALSAVLALLSAALAARALATACTSGCARLAVALLSTVAAPASAAAGGCVRLSPPTASLPTRANLSGVSASATFENWACSRSAISFDVLSACSAASSAFSARFSEAAACASASPACCSAILRFRLAVTNSSCMFLMFLCATSSSLSSSLCTRFLCVSVLLSAASRSAWELSLSSAASSCCLSSSTALCLPTWPCTVSTACSSRCSFSSSRPTGTSMASSFPCSASRLVSLRSRSPRGTAAWSSSTRLRFCRSASRGSSRCLSSSKWLRTTW